MNNQTKTKAHGPLATIGCVLILIGTSIGAGMLALPMASAQLSFPICCIMLVIVWWVMSITGLYIVEVNIMLSGQRNHFSSMARATTGKLGQLIAWVSSLCLFYTLICAYISGNSSLLGMAIERLTGYDIAPMLSASLFTIVVAAIIFYSTRGVDLWMRGLMTFKGIALLVILLGLMPYIHVDQIWNSQHNVSGNFVIHTLNPWYSLLLAAPVFLVGFGYHAVIPSFVNYIGPNPARLRLIIWCGTTISLVIYLLWLMVSFGILPLSGPHSLQALHAHGSHIDQFLHDIETIMPAVWLKIAVNAFSDVAMLTSCLGVGLGLFDFLADGLKRTHHWHGRMQTVCITLLPPLLVVWLWPNVFLLGISLAGLWLIILEVLLPAFMWWGFRHKPSLPEHYRVKGGRILACSIIIFGILFLIAALAARFS